MSEELGRAIVETASEWAKWARELNTRPASECADVVIPIRTAMDRLEVLVGRAKGMRFAGGLEAEIIQAARRKVKATRRYMACALRRRGDPHTISVEQAASNQELDTAVARFLEWPLFDYGEEEPT